LLLVRDLAEHGDEVGGIEGPVLVGEHPRVALARLDVVDAVLAGSAHRVVEHLLLDVEYVQRAGRDPVRDVQRVVAGSGSDLEEGLARLRPQGLLESGPRDERVRRLDPEALVVGAGAGVLSPPEGAADGCHGGAECELRPRSHQPRDARHLALDAGEALEELVLVGTVAVSFHALSMAYPQGVYSVRWQMWSQRSGTASGTPSSWPGRSGGLSSSAS